MTAADVLTASKMLAFVLMFPASVWIIWFLLYRRRP